ncbi:MAG: hypothetical protein LBQ43_02915 [Holosporales bacterium]|jgi:hypothetical protein|nr:hypothetical protein [Holosporales bacterium]
MFIGRKAFLCLSLFIAVTSFRCVVLHASQVVDDLVEPLINTQPPIFKNPIKGTPSHEQGAIELDPPLLAGEHQINTQYSRTELKVTRKPRRQSPTKSTNTSLAGESLVQNNFGSEYSCGTSTSSSDEKQQSSSRFKITKKPRRQSPTESNNTSLAGGPLIQNNFGSEYSYSMSTSSSDDSQANSSNKGPWGDSARQEPPHSRALGKPKQTRGPGMSLSERRELREILKSTPRVELTPKTDSTPAPVVSSTLEKIQTLPPASVTGSASAKVQTLPPAIILAQSKVVTQKMASVLASPPALVQTPPSPPVMAQTPPPAQVLDSPPEKIQTTPPASRPMGKATETRGEGESLAEMLARRNGQGRENANTQ